MAVDHPGALTIARAIDHLSIIVAAGPYRLSLTAAPARLGSETILTLGTGGAVGSRL